MISFLKEQKKLAGSALLSHPVTRAVPSAKEGLTSGFGMEPGVSLPLLPPARFFSSWLFAINFWLLDYKFLKTNI